MRGWKRPFIGVLVACSWLLGGCGEVEPTLRDTEVEDSLPFSQSLAGTQTTAFQDGVAPTTGYAGTRDAMIEEEDSNANHGSATNLSASGDTPAGSGNENYVLLAWDVSSIPSNAVVRSASLTVTVSDKADQDYQLYALTRGWTESQVTWEQADNSQDWASNGADGTGDRDTSVLGTLRAPATGTYTVALNASGVAAVQRWVSTPASNQGLILANKDNDNRLELRSSEYSTKASRPKLTVTWDTQGTPGGEVPASGTFKGTCDGSGGAWVDGTHFLNVNDESQTVRVYARSQNASAVKSQDVSSAIGISSSDEADLEDVARVGNRLYVTGSHARNKDGELESSRYKFFAIDVTGTAPAVTLQVAGTSSTLLRDLLNATNWDVPDTAVLTLLNERSRLSEPTVASLAPKVNGTNVEGLAALPSGELAIGFRNPRVGSSALVVTLTNPGAVLTGATARFGRAIRLSLGGQGLRGMAWSEAHQAVLLLSGPYDESSGPFALWKWSGDASSAPVKVVDLTAPANSAPEAVIPYPGSLAVQVLFDMGSRLIGGTECKDVSSSSQSFSDVFIHVD